MFQTLLLVVLDAAMPRVLVLLQQLFILEDSFLD